MTRHCPILCSARAATLADVAAEAGCSTAVVSCVVNGARGKISVRPETRTRVIEAAQRLDYRPHFASRSLARRRSQTLGVFVEPGPWAGLGYSYEGSILIGVEAACRSHDYDILAINLGGSQTPESCTHKFIEQRIDGLLLLHVRTDAAWVEPLCAVHPNVAAVNYYGSCRGLDILNFDNEAAGRMAARHFADLGHRRVGYIGSLKPDTGPGTEQRRKGFQREVARRGLECRPEWILDPPNECFMDACDSRSYDERFAFAAETVRALGLDGPTAWLVYNDGIAARMCREFRLLGLQIPRDLSLMGIDDSERAVSCDPRLSTVRQPFAVMGEQAAEWLIQRSEQGIAECPHTLLLSEPELVARETTAAWRQT